MNQFEETIKIVKMFFLLKYFIKTTFRLHERNFSECLRVLLRVLVDFKRIESKNKYECICYEESLVPFNIRRLCRKYINIDSMYLTS